jgi:hypothetical protein
MSEQSGIKYITITYVSNVGRATNNERSIPEHSTLQDFLDSEFGGTFVFGNYLVRASYNKSENGQTLRVQREEQTNGDLVLKTGDRVTVSPTKVDAGQQ